MSKIGVYAGTFDPITHGHRDIIRRAMSLVDHLIIAVAESKGKEGMLFSVEERVIMVENEITQLKKENRSNIEIKAFDSLLIHFVVLQGASLIIRGLRAVSDFEYEFQMSTMNSRLNPHIETVFLMASEANQFISSRLVKEISVFGGDVSYFVSEYVVKQLQKHHQKNTIRKRDAHDE